MAAIYLLLLLLLIKSFEVYGSKYPFPYFQICITSTQGQKENVILLLHFNFNNSFPDWLRYWFSHSYLKLAHLYICVHTHTYKQACIYMYVFVYTHPHTDTETEKIFKSKGIGFVLSF